MLRAIRLFWERMLIRWLLRRWSTLTEKPFLCSASDAWALWEVVRDNLITYRVNGEKIQDENEVRASR